MESKYIVVEIEEKTFMAVTKAQDGLNYKTRPVGHYKFLIPEMRKICESICDISKLNNPYLLQIL